MLMESDNAALEATQTALFQGLNIPTGHVLASTKWISTELASVLKGGGRVLFDDNLGVIDFYPSRNVGVVYISEGEAVGGQAYKRKLAKLRMSNTVKGVVIVERTPTSSQYYSALQKFTVLDLGLVLIPVVSQTNAAQVLLEMQQIAGDFRTLGIVDCLRRKCASARRHRTARRHRRLNIVAKVESHPHSNSFKLKLKLSSPDQSLLATLQLIPRLGEIKAKALLERFPSIIDICNASDEELTGAIGRQCALAVHNFFSQPLRP